MRIVVIGGRGFLGSRAVRALRGAPGVEVVCAGRHGDLVVDLHRPETFAALDGADVVVNASSSHLAPPDALAAFCLTRGHVLLEASSDRVVVERLLDTFRGRDAQGALVLGAGIFTGISNALAAHASRAVGGARSIELGVSSSPFSGAGGGTIDLMADAVATPTRVVRAGARVDAPPIAPGPAMPFVEGERATVHVAFAEPVMVHASTGARDVAMYMAPAPAWLRRAFLALPLSLVRSRVFGALFRVYFRFLRRVLLRSVVTRVGLVARARRDEREHVAMLSFDDGFDAGGVAIAATALVLARRGGRVSGTFVVDELVPLDVMLSVMRQIDGSLRFTARGVSD
ncbi:hypothetical protein [Sandaracinus amylolyticus]|uniref:Saccharopine dehydrogenase NADP binding domain-containing protein n=1 Tax=Sandaracinus amylolyticus TaxID=927083 RepID=A0A0F6SGS1_9BACT|nr:hypothetical protein [Sandaracinus amylolyticus]AKF09184.1 hypothetical protein DB32_006333 [Sandaracinus amylolyticus]